MNETDLQQLIKILKSNNVYQVIRWDNPNSVVIQLLDERGETITILERMED